MLLLLAEGAGGKTLIGIAPLFGLDPETREGTRAVGPLTAIWYAVFMIPFFLWVREPPQAGRLRHGRQAVREAMPELVATLKAPAQDPQPVPSSGRRCSTATR
jgi:MFS transporter, UMF1 family